MSKEAMLIAEVAVLTEMVRVLSDKLAIEQNKQEQGEPVAWMDIDEKGAASGLRYWSEPDNRHEVALYTTPQQRKPLTDEQITKIWEKRPYFNDFARAIEAKLKEKNT